MGVIGKDGKARVRIIAPGWGSSGHYSEKTLQDAAPLFSDVGVYWDHPSAADEVNRPERSLRDLAGKVSGTPVYEANGKVGPGLYADVQVFKPYQEALEELAPHIGMSIRAMGQAKSGEAEGRKGKLIEKIVSVRSVDAVTAAGAGGKILSLYEAARTAARTGTPAPTPTVKEPETVTPEEATRLTEAQAATNTALAEAQREIARLREVNLLREARDFVATTLRGMQMPEPTRARLTEQLATAPVVKDGALDVEAYRTHIQETAKAEVAYLTSVTGAGRISGMGSVAVISEAPSAEAVTASLETAFGRLGLSEASAKVAAAGRA